MVNSRPIINVNETKPKFNSTYSPINGGASKNPQKEGTKSPYA